MNSKVLLRKMRMTDGANLWMVAGYIVPIKNHIHPHTFKFTLGRTRWQKMLYKSRANDKVRQPADGPLIILKSVPEGAPKLVQPTLGGRDTLPLKDLKAKVQFGSHRRTEDHLHRWEDFIKDEQTLRSRWDEMMDECLKEFVQENWCIPKLVQMIQQHDKTKSWKDSKIKKRILQREPKVLTSVAFNLTLNPYYMVCPRGLSWDLYCS